MRLFIIFLTLLALSGCKKPDPNPELRDEIYADLNSQLTAVSNALKEEEKKYAESKNELLAVKPQTGQIKYAEKRVFESENKITILKQEKQWLEIRIAERLKETRKNYLKAFKEGKEWPNKADFEQYQAQKKLKSAPRAWNAKKRIQELNAPPKKPAGESSGH